MALQTCIRYLQIFLLFSVSQALCKQLQRCDLYRTRKQRERSNLICTQASATEPFKPLAAFSFSFLFFFILIFCSFQTLLLNTHLFQSRQCVLVLVQNYRDRTSTTASLKGFSSVQRFIACDGQALQLAVFDVLRCLCASPSAWSSLRWQEVHVPLLLLH